MSLLTGSVLDSFLVDLKTSSTNSSVKTAAASALSALGFSSWIFACENPNSMLGRSHLLSGLTLTWITKYLAKGYLHIDPIVKHCQESEEPLVWDTVEGWNSAGDDIKDFLRDIHASGFRSGMAIPLRSPTGRIGLLSIVTPQPLSEARASYLQNMESARAVGMAVHSAIERITSK
jgi:hypothetical protein